MLVQIQASKGVAAMEAAATAVAAMVAVVMGAVAAAMVVAAAAQVDMEEPLPAVMARHQLSGPTTLPSPAMKQHPGQATPPCNPAGGIVVSSTRGYPHHDVMYLYHTHL